LNSITYVDIFIVAITFAIVLIAGLYIAFRSKETPEGYFLAGRSVGWIAIGMSIFAANISSEHFVGLAGYGASRGLAVGNFEWLAIIFLMLLGWLFAPIFLKSKIYTLPEFLGKRFNDSTRIYLSTLSIITYLLTKILVALFAGGLILNKLMGLDMYTSAVIMILITGVYTIAGGLGAVIYTSVIQSFLLIIGALVLTIIGLNEIGGITALHQKLPESYFNLFNSVSDPDIPWTGIVFGAPILALWYWCSDQYIVQRVLSAKSIGDARSGTLLTGFLKILPVFILVLPGLTAAVIFPGIKGDQAYPALITSGLLPAGLRGLVVAGLLAALMSSLASSFNSAATLFTMDIYRIFKKDVSDRKLVLVGRLATTVMVILGILWIPLTKYISSYVYVFLQSIQAFISPPIAAVFLFGIFWKRANSTGALCALFIGGALGTLRLILEFYIGSISPDYPFWQWILEINYLHFAVFLFAISSMILIVVSLLSEKENIIKIRKFTFNWQDTTTPSFTGSVGGTQIGLNRMTLMFSIVLLIILLGLWSRVLI
jgi:SSS family solute:Na+ symporter